MHEYAPHLASKARQQTRCGPGCIRRKVCLRHKQCKRHTAPMVCRTYRPNAAVSPTLEQSGFARSGRFLAGELGDCKSFVLDPREAGKVGLDFRCQRRLAKVALIGKSLASLTALCHSPIHSQLDPFPVSDRSIRQSQQVLVLSGNRLQVHLLGRLKRFAVLPGVLDGRHDPEVAVGVAHDSLLGRAIDEQSHDLLPGGEHTWSSLACGEVTCGIARIRGGLVPAIRAPRPARVVTNQ